MDHVTILRNGLEEKAERNLSPTRVIRAIASLALKWNFNCFFILTEPKFGKEQLFHIVIWKANI